MDRQDDAGDHGPILQDGAPEYVRGEEETVQSLLSSRHANMGNGETAVQ